MFCYRVHRPAATCSPGDVIQNSIGDIANYADLGHAKPTKLQCFALLTIEWPFVNYWFFELFAGFTGPAPASNSELLGIKSILQLWILQFGPNEMQAWTEVLSAVTGDWKGYTATLKDGFSTDNGENFTPFPEKLQSWLGIYCGNDTNLCTDLLVFNRKDPVCEDETCSSSLASEYCSRIQPNSACAQSHNR